MKKPKVSIIGLGFVGLTLAVTNAKKGFETTGIDTDNNKIARLRLGHPDFYEPKLKKYLDDSLRTKKILFTNQLSEVPNTDITFITVGTPPLDDGRIDLSQVKKVSSSLAKILKKKKSNHLVVIKSTVIPTTTQNHIAPLFKSLRNVSVLSNPEFLREVSAVDDTLYPHLIVIGQDNKKDGDKLEKYYRSFYAKMPEVLRTGFTTAELIKYSNNALLATKVSFINSIANICQNIPKTDVNTVAYAIGKDPRIGPDFLKAGPGFGGSCLPKDISALIEFSNKFDDVNSLLKAVKEVNDTQPLRIFKMINQMTKRNRNKTIAILGLAFKKGTDDIREAVSVKLVRMLIRKGFRVKVHDPMAIKNFKSLFTDKVSYSISVDQCLKNSNCCVILTEWDNYKKIKPQKFKNTMKTVNIIDTRRVLEPSKFLGMNFKAIGLGNRDGGK